MNSKTYSSGDGIKPIQQTGVQTEADKILRPNLININ